MTKNVLEWLEQTAVSYGEKVAFMDADHRITFEQVFQKARRIGIELLKRCKVSGSVECKRPIAVMTGKSVQTPVAYLGVVYSGRPYAPIDAGLPTARIEKILQTLAPAAIITDADSREQVEQYVAELCMDTCVYGLEALMEGGAITEEEQEQLNQVRGRMVSTDPLYLIFTSGSTGNPKGVITSHASLMHYINAYSKVMGITEEDVLGNQAPLDYIAAIRDIYLPMKHGCSTVLIPKEFFMDPNALFTYLNEHRVTSVAWSVSAFTVPVSLGAFSEVKLDTLKKVCFSGSVMPCRQLRVWQENLPEALFVNQYGPTEATASCTYYVVDHLVAEDEVLPIGHPYENYQVFLLTEDGREAEVQEEGEICVAGPILALGYYNDPVRTAASFVQNPLQDGYRELIYKTGDIGVWRADGLLEFHGRKDRQVKHMGHRVELDEVEYAANQLEAVAESCCIYNKEKERLSLFYTGDVDKRTLVVELRKSLPGFMVPRTVKQLDVMPKLDNGKIDMKALEQLK